VSERRWDEAALLEWLLNAGAPARAGRAAIEREPGAAARLAGLEAFLERCRAGCAGPEVEAGAERDLVERVLARTTREDLSWRGDLRLVGGFLAARLRSSVVVRIAAASLLVHLCALPLLAMMGFFESAPPGPVIRVEPPRERIFQPQEPEPLVLSEESVRDEGAQIALRGERYVQNSLRRARRALRSGAPLLPAPAPGETRAAAILRARCALLSGAKTPVAPPAPAPDVGLVERSLWCEYLLDRYLVEGTEPRGLTRAVAGLARAELERDPGGLLAASALARAASYGLVGADVATRLERARAALAGRAQAAPLLGGEDDLRRAAPLDGAWLEALRTEGAALGLDPAAAEALWDWRPGEAE